VGLPPGSIRGVYPIVWLLLLPFRIVGISVAGVLNALRAIVTLPGQLLHVGAG
jgi:hypothetical protein